MPPRMRNHTNRPSFLSPCRGPRRRPPQRQEATVGPTGHFTVPNGERVKTSNQQAHWTFFLGSNKASGMDGVHFQRPFVVHPSSVGLAVREKQVPRRAQQPPHERHLTSHVKLRRCCSIQSIQPPLRTINRGPHLFVLASCPSNHPTKHPTRVQIPTVAAVTSTYRKRCLNVLELSN